jgi:ribose 5-phosphate isomerase B
MKVYLAADHAGFQLKQKLLESLGERWEMEDCGAHAYDAADNYPEIIAGAMQRLIADIHANVESRAIVIGKSGQGEAMAANRFPGVRAAVYYGGNAEILQLSREHNDANVLSLGADFLTETEALRCVPQWLEIDFSGEERHQKRREMLDHLPNNA